MIFTTSNTESLHRCNIDNAKVIADIEFKDSLSIRILGVCGRFTMPTAEQWDTLYAALLACAEQHGGES